MHKLSRKDPDTMRGDCSECGLDAELLHKGKRLGCAFAIRRQRKQNASGKKHVNYQAESRNGHGLSNKEAKDFCQGKLCAVCGSGDDLVADHSHATGNIRGVLCRKCNAGTGMLNDNIILLERAISYLESENDTVPY